MIREGRHRWGRLSSPDVLVDVGLALVSAGFAGVLCSAGDISGAGLAVGLCMFVVGTSLLVRGFLLPLIRGQQTSSSRRSSGRRR